MVKIWNIAEDADSNKRQVSLVSSRDLGVVRVMSFYPSLLCYLRILQGKVFSVAWSPDDPLTLAAAGSKAKVQVWDVGANAGVRKVLGPKLAEAGRTVKEKTTGGVIGVESDHEDSSGDEGDE